MVTKTQYFCDKCGAELDNDLLDMLMVHVEFDNNYREKGKSEFDHSSFNGDYCPKCRDDIISFIKSIMGMK